MKEWDWELHPDADKFLKDSVGEFRKGCEACAQLADRIESKTSTRFFDWVDHIMVPASKVDPQILVKLGFKEQEVCSEQEARVFRHDGSTLFPVLVSDGRKTGLAIKVEELSEFQKMNGVPATISGTFNSPLRTLRIHDREGFVLSAVERRGSAGFIVGDAKDVDPYDAAYKTFLTRRRVFIARDKGLDDFERQVVSDLDWLDKARVADAFIRAERAYWSSRNVAAKIQKARQNVLGLGFANSDHHSFRSSRNQFEKLTRVFSMIGLVPRERMYAGPQAGWGARVFEQPECGFVVTAEVDLAPDETTMDFPEGVIPELDRPGTVGLWTELHGESILEAGLHHVALRLDFDRARRDLRMTGVETMKPVSFSPFLKQAFTKGDMWKVDSTRVSELGRRGSITSDQAARFISQGAIGSHLESIQRDQGFKGFEKDSGPTPKAWNPGMAAGL